MNILNKYILSFALIASVSTFAQEAAEGEPTTIQGLLQLVEQGRTTEQGINAKREADFLADKANDDCFDLEAFESIIDNSRDPAELLKAWEGWRTYKMPNNILRAC